MYVETRETTRKGKSYTYHYLRQSYREGRNVGITGSPVSRIAPTRKSKRSAWL